MLSKIVTAGILGVDSYLIDVEADLGEGLASFDIVGLPDMAVKESRERIKSAIKHSNSDLYRKRIVVNLAPAALRKEGSHYDFPIALAVMGSRIGFLPERLRQSVFIGELSLNGELREVNGVLPIAIEAFKQGKKNIFLPPGNAREASIVTGLNIFPIAHLMDAVFYLSGEKDLKPYVNEDSFHSDHTGGSLLDFCDVKGQEDIKRALLVAASGGHNFLMIGSPGSGKTMIASRIPSILPSLTFEESLEVSRIYSVAGLIRPEEPLIVNRPFRQVHHTISTAGITGGGRIPKPGELSLAHRGVLFLDEIPEFKRDTLETLRQPLEDGKITVTRVSGSSTYPCSVMVIASLNPCPCGYYGSGLRECSCSPNQIKNYMKRISGPLLDRIDIQIEVGQVEYDALSQEKSQLSSAVMREQVLRAREIQKERYQDQDFFTNKEIPPGLLDEFCSLGAAEKTLMEQAFQSLGMSARAHARILKVARTIADLEGSKNIEGNHLAEAIQYRSLDKKYF